jgi:hypothetical protein
MEKKKIQIHKVLPELLKKKNVSIREVSRKTSVPQATLNSWTKDGSKPSDVNLCCFFSDGMKIANLVCSKPRGNTHEKNAQTFYTRTKS